MNAPNLFAGMGAHQSARSQTDCWLTPPAIVEALGGADSFDLDPASLPERPWPTARQHYTEVDNGLMLPWFGRVWLNPPYSTDLVRRFLARMAGHGQGVALIFARTETESFHRHVWGAASGLLFLRRRRRELGIGSDMWLWILGAGYGLALTFTYLTTPHDLTWHLATSVDRTNQVSLNIVVASAVIWLVVALSPVLDPPSAQQAQVPAEEQPKPVAAEV